MTVRLKVRERNEPQQVRHQPRRLLAPDGTAPVTRIDDRRRCLLREASDPSTSPWRLAALADDFDPEIRLSVAANPSASSLTIMHLRCDIDPRIGVVLSARGGPSR